MNLRKFSNIPTQRQLAIIEQDNNHILDECDKIAEDERKDLKRSQESHDYICPKCRAKREDIVNKIRKVSGGGRVSGDFFLGFGSVNGSLSIDTHAVNHCNKCGNEWEKFKSKSISRTDVLRVCLNYLADIIKKPEEKKYSWKVDAVKVFDGCSAETIRALILKESHWLRSDTNIILTLRILRRHYKSVYDKN